MIEVAFDAWFHETGTKAHALQLERRRKEEDEMLLISHLSNIVYKMLNRKQKRNNDNVHKKETGKQKKLNKNKKAGKFKTSHKNPCKSTF